MYFPPSLLYPHGDFEPSLTLSAPTLTTTPTTPQSTSSLRPSSKLYPSQKRGTSTLTSGGESVYLAEATHFTGCEPKMQLNKSISEDGDATPITDPDRDNLSDFSLDNSALTHLFCMFPVVVVFCLKGGCCGNSHADREKMEKNV